MRVFAHRFFLLTLACMLCLGASAKKKEKGVYLFGYGTALLDSTVYLSAPVFLDSATIDPKTKIVNSIVRYSNQFQSYVEALYQPHVTCAVFYHTDKAKLEKQYLKIRRRVNNDKSLRLTEIAAEEFKFVWVPNDERTHNSYLGEMPEKASKKKKKKADVPDGRPSDNMNKSNKRRGGKR